MPLFEVLIILMRHFVLFFSILSQKEKFYVKRKTILSQAAWSFFRILCRMDIYFKMLVIYQSGITMNISNMLSITVLSNLEFKLIFSVLKKSCKNECICPSDIRLSDIVTSSSISLIIFSIDFFVSQEDWKLPQYSYNLMK